MLKNTSEISGDIDFRPLEKGDKAAVCGLLFQTGASIDGTRSPMVYRAVCNDALAGGNAVIIISSKDRDVVGCVLALIDRKVYWRLFLFRHPVTAFHVITSIMARKIRAVVNFSRQSAPRALHQDVRISEKPSGMTWQESSPFIAKIMHIAVTDTSRNMGIGKGLYDHLLNVLAGRGIKRVDANIALDNAPSIRLHLSTGWHIEKAPHNFFATIDISR
jgi:hypothetical protein